MATDAQRKKAVNKGIREGKAELKKIVSDRRAVIRGLILSATSEPNFVSSSTARNKLYADLRSQYKQLNSDIDSWTMKNGTAAAKEARKFAILDLPSGTKVGTFGQFSEKHLDDIIGAINPSTVDKQVAINAKIGGMYDRDIQIFRQTVSSTIAQGAVEGLTNPEMSAIMQKAVKDAGNLIFVDRAGRKWSADAYFGMLNRTLHASVARESYNATATDAGFDLAQIEGGITAGSLENPSDPCSRWAGKIISLTGATKGYPTYQDAVSDGMFHPNCVHFTRVVLPSEIPDAKKEQTATAEEGAEARREVNEERKDDGLKPNKYAGTDGKAATSGAAKSPNEKRNEYDIYRDNMKSKYGDDMYLKATDAEIDKFEKLEREHFAKKNKVNNLNENKDEFTLNLSNYKPKIKETEFHDPSEIIPVNETDNKKVDEIRKSLKQNGWIGEPIVVADSPNGTAALTGSHRIAAARELNVEVPVYKVDSELVEALASRDNNFGIEDLIGGSDEDRLEVMKRLKDRGAIRLLKMEIDANDG